MTEPNGPAWRQTIYHPFALTSNYGRGTALRVSQNCDTIETRKFGEVDSLGTA